MENLSIHPKVLFDPLRCAGLMDFDPAWLPEWTEKSDALALLEENIQNLSSLQDRLFSVGAPAVLIIFQGIDAAGKDGTIKHVMSGLNPQGSRVVSFKAPTPLELAHDYFWRTYLALPAKGEVVVFNRSYYEEVLVTRVHPQWLLRQRLPIISSVEDADEAFWQMRFKQINNMEQMLTENGTIIIKFCLNISKEQQKRRFLKRLSDPTRNWKFEAGDLEERRHWDAYMHAYSQMLVNTSTTWAPWYVIPADQKWFMRYAVSNVLVHRFESLQLHYPQLNETEKQMLAHYRMLLENE